MDCFLFQSREFVDARLLAGGLAGKAAKGLAIAAQCAAEHIGVAAAILSPGEGEAIDCSPNGLK
jgi:hypothetical protein